MSCTLIFILSQNESQRSSKKFAVGQKLSSFVNCIPHIQLILLELEHNRNFTKIYKDSVKSQARILAQVKGQGLFFEFDHFDRGRRSRSTARYNGVPPHCYTILA